MNARTLLYAVVGAAVTVIGGFLPFVTFVAPLLGGVVAGYLEDGSGRLDR